jgi:predicted ATPase
MKRYVMTGAPGCGKTAILRELQVRGYAVVEEAATDVIACEQAHGVEQPWSAPGFVHEVVALQRRRQEQPAAMGTTIQIYDRSPICTLALAEYLAQPVTDVLAAEVDRVVRNGIYERRVFFVRPLGFVRASPARQITFEESLAFESLHERTYRSHGYELVEIPGDEVAERAERIDRQIQAWDSRSRAQMGAEAQARRRA